MAKIAVVGCGAMGSVYAALMVDAGHEVHAVTLWPDHAAAMAAKGLRCEGASGDRTVPIHASTTTDGIGPCDLVIIATKSFDVEAAAQSCRPLLGSETIVQTIQNGLGSPEIAAPILGADRVAVGVVGGFGASIRAPGHAHHNGMEMIRFGAYAGMPRAVLEREAPGIAEAMRSASREHTRHWMLSRGTAGVAGGTKIGLTLPGGVQASLNTGSPVNVVYVKSITAGTPLLVSQFKLK